MRKNFKFNAFFVMSILFLFAFACGGKDSSTEDQVASFELKADKTEGVAPLLVNFTISNLTNGGYVKKYIWDFNYEGLNDKVYDKVDETEFKITESHTFTTPGDYTVYLKLEVDSHTGSGRMVMIRVK